MSFLHKHSIAATWGVCCLCWFFFLALCLLPGLCHFNGTFLSVLVLQTKSSMSCPAGLGHATDPTSAGPVWAEHDLPCKNKPSRLVAGSPVASWTKKTFPAFPAAYVGEQDLLLCFPCGLFTYPGSAGSGSGQRNIQLGWLGIHSPVSQLADGTQGVFVCAKGNRGNHWHSEDWGGHSFVKSPDLVGNRERWINGERHRKTSAQKHWLCVAVSKLIPTLQLISKAEFHPDPSPNRCLYATVPILPKLAEAALLLWNKASATGISNSDERHLPFPSCTFPEHSAKILCSGSQSEFSPRKTGTTLKCSYQIKNK